MARNLKPEYLKKLLATETPNGYKFDLANYVYNPHRNYEYPTFKKVLSETEDTETVREVRYFKFYDGDGVYEAVTYDRPKTTDNGWYVVREPEPVKLESSRRFSLKTLVSYC